MLNTELNHNTYRTALKATAPMKAVRFHGPGDIRIEEIEEPVCGKGQVKVRPAYVGICGSDIHEYTAGPVLVPQEPHKITGVTAPVTLGHEFSGIVEEVGEGVTHVSKGQRVVIRPTIYDGTCPSCRSGYEHCCENIGFIGLSGYGGGLAHKQVAPATHFYPIPDNISLESAALIEPLAVAWHAVNVSPFKPNQHVLVVGGGPVGIGIVQVLKMQGAKTITVAEPMARRREFALEYGATHAIDPKTEDVTEQIRNLTNGLGAHVVFDSAGVEQALCGEVDACRTHGTIVNIAVWEKQPSMPVNELMYNEVQYTGAALYDESAFQDVIRALNYGQLKPDRMITSIVKLDDVVEKGFQALVDDRGEHCKILVDVQASV
ncbi:uncharacterized protein LDX57_011075 [Aspergillus melleus]|uniref:uncharacterized protein n=1 Tax=Aspergillus melleus TaxID=138277 RepID=UPI001E8E80B9|nr:uncharacterized protein LDX57_011075 [Aspergillus melleus]KAH8433441.1 hypothetical protein LDX57_011075 [Aspergillus melleus]